MSTKTTNATFEAYLDALIERGDFGRFFATDVELSVTGMPNPVTGRAEVTEFIRVMHQETFDARPELRALVADPHYAAIEVVFVGTHKETFASIPATGRPVRVPYTVIYEFDGDKIKALRIYGLFHGLLEQLR